MSQIQVVIGKFKSVILRIISPIRAQFHASLVETIVGRIRQGKAKIYVNRHQPDGASHQ
jgi:hypothetical protein